MIADLLLALFALFATWADTPADEPAPVVHVEPAPAPAPPVATPRVRPTTPHHAPPAAVAVLAAPSGCAVGEEWQDEFGCVALQLPEEITGRAIDEPLS